MSDNGDGQRLSGDTLPILPEAILAKLAEAGRTERFAKGQTIFRQSDVGDCMYVVEEGEVGLVFDPAVRRGGVGTALVAAAEKWAASRGAATMRVRSNTARDISHPFYEALGYTRSKTQHVYTRSLGSG